MHAHAAWNRASDVETQVYFAFLDWGQLIGRRCGQAGKGIKWSHY